MVFSSAGNPANGSLPLVVIVVFGSCFENHAFFFCAAFGADNGYVRLQEGCGYADCAIEQAARVVAQVEDDAFERAFCFL